MFYLSLPYMYENRVFNKFFASYCNKFPEKLKTELKVESFYGSLPWSIWNGGTNSNIENQLTYNQIQDFINTECFGGLPIVLDCSNQLINESEFYNRYQNLILQLAQDTSIYIEVSNIKLYEYIKTKYENYRFIISDKINNVVKLNEQAFNLFKSQKDIIRIILPKEYDITQLSSKAFYSVIIGENVNICDNCKMIEQNNQIDFSEKSQFINCRTCPNKNSLNYFEEIEQYLKQGITHFKISDIHGEYSLSQFNLNLILNFIKPEYIRDFYDNLYSSYLEDVK